MAWTKQQKAAHSKRMKAMWQNKKINEGFSTTNPKYVALPSPITWDTPDPVEHPPHYTNHPSGIECIQVTEHMNFCRGNAVKYIWRAGEKGDEVEDLAKAVWYLNREIDRITKEKANAKV